MTYVIYHHLLRLQDGLVPRSSNPLEEVLFDDINEATMLAFDVEAVVEEKTRVLH